MRTTGWVIAGTVMAGAVLSMGASAQPTGARPAATRHAANTPPVVIELFTAQGCGSCLEANAAVERAAAEPGVIALTYGVDYWDYLGWTDTFAQPEFSERQRAYRAALRLRGVSTPEVVIDGRRQMSGARAAELEAAIDEEASRLNWPPQIEFRETGDRVGIGSGRAPVGGAEVIAVTYTPGPQVVQVRSGENRGQSVRHMNVVRDIKRLGDWRGRPVLYVLPEVRSGEALAILVQTKTDRRIIGAKIRS
ncbi:MULTISPECIES: DUF1223 domain-containing protein [unclassified Brevundimonas]|uniref:DUF1223 domain-containing protein n=1 Tax=unclassified Brevundimonas TaxID=2622653 RepID=UPI000E85BB71|nr:MULTISPECIES: DUF1223 domain-containing protein [unclassified Brevundimonas]MCK6105635.1 DUF1223 domain-containing protein [Brevundimonas sp. EYE_349]HBI18046.1 DUF1223 domain-containing protein [Brevundimonas sp.]